VKRAFTHFTIPLIIAVVLYSFVGTAIANVILKQTAVTCVFLILWCTQAPYEELNPTGPSQFLQSVLIIVPISLLIVYGLGEVMKKEAIISFISSFIIIIT